MVDGIEQILVRADCLVVFEVRECLLEQEDEGGLYAGGIGAICREYVCAFTPCLLGGLSRGGVDVLLCVNRLKVQGVLFHSFGF